MPAVLLFHECYAPGQKIVGVIKNMPENQPGLRLRMLGAALVYDRTRANPKHFNATHWIGHASAMEHGTIFFDLKIPLQESGQSDNSLVSFSTTLPESMLPSFSSAYNSAFVTVSYGLCLHSDTGEVLAVEPVTITQNAPEESGRMNKKTRLATFVARSSSWYQHGNTSYLAATVDMDEVDNLTSGSTLSLRLHARSVQVKSLRFTVEQRLELSLPYDGQPRRVKQKAVIASSVRELSSGSPSEFKKRYFITMPTLCTTIESPIISTKYTVRIQMTSARVPALTLEVPVTMYSKGSFINGLPSPMSNPGLTPEWAKVILDSHQKLFADECPICFSEISHRFGGADLTSTASTHPAVPTDDVASCGTAESDELAPPATAVDGQGQGTKRGSAAFTDVASSPGGVVQGTASTAKACESGAHEADDPVQEAEGAGIEDQMDREHDSHVPKLDESKHPDLLVDDILALKEGQRTKEQLLLMYKTCRYRELAMTEGVAYASCSHAFHPLCLLECEKHASQAVDAPLKCPLCRQEYTVRHFIPDANLRSLCLEHTITEAIALAETAAKEADEKAKDAAHAKAIAIEAARKAAALKQRMGSAFCSSDMSERLNSLLQMVHRPVAMPVPAHTGASLHNRTSMSPLSSVGGAVPTPPLISGGGTSSMGGQADGQSLSFALPPSSATGVTGTRPTLPGSDAAPAAPAPDLEPANRPPGSPLPGIDLTQQVPLHQQIASMRMSSDTEASALQHPEVVLDSTEAGDGDHDTVEEL